MSGKESKRSILLLKMVLFRTKCYVGPVDSITLPDGEVYSLVFPETVTSAELDRLCGIFKNPIPYIGVKKRIASQILDYKYISQLLEMHSSFEDLESLEDLFKLFHIFKGITLLGDINIISQIVLDENIMRYVKVFECKNQSLF
jgi:hypothetical protein